MSPLDVKHPPPARANAREAEGLRDRGLGAPPVLKGEDGEGSVQVHQDAGLKIEGTVMASDAFFPFRDSVDAAAEAGVTAIIQPGGSIRDEEVVAAADEHGIAMVFTGMRHFRH